MAFENIFKKEGDDEDIIISTNYNGIYNIIIHKKKVGIAMQSNFLSEDADKIIDALVLARDTSKRPITLRGKCLCCGKEVVVHMERDMYKENIAKAYLSKGYNGGDLHGWSILAPCDDGESHEITLDQMTVIPDGMEKIQ